MSETTITPHFAIPLPRELGRSLALQPGQRVQLLVDQGELRVIPLERGGGFGEKVDIPAHQLLEELATLQGVQPVESIDELYGGWPEDELDDGFEETLHRWRQEEREAG